MPMGEGPLKLHVGCGNTYLPGFVNIDNDPASVADIQADAMDLPFPPDSVDEIHAYHLIEHFDLIHAHYLLAHWFSLMKPGGTLVIETPDLTDTFKTFMRSDENRKRTLLQWIYGVDSPGMGHKTGFDHRLLTRLLEQCGFEEIKRVDPLTHLYENGLRLVARKPELPSPHHELLAEYRMALLSEVENIQDSMELIPIEQLIMTQLNPESFDPSEMVSILANLTCINPVITDIFLRIADKDQFHSLFPILHDRERVAGLRSLVQYLLKHAYHQRLFTLWMRSRKEPGEMAQDFSKFIEEKEAVLCLLFSSTQIDETMIEKRLGYVLTLPPTPIPFFHETSVRWSAKMCLNNGIKEFHLSNHSDALHLLEISVSQDPNNPFTHWNLARLCGKLGREQTAILGYLQTAFVLFKQLGRNSLTKLVKSEIASVRDAGVSSLPGTPIPEIAGY